MPKRRGTTQEEPQIVAMPPHTMAVVHTKGSPHTVWPRAMPALYAAVYELKFECRQQGRDFKVGALRARWPDAHLVPQEHWRGLWGLPIPDDTPSVPQKVPGIAVRIEVWAYGTVAQLLHVGRFSTEPAALERLHAFITAQGYAVAGVYEEEYLSTPNAPVPKTIMRYPIKKLAHEQGIQLGIKSG